MHLPEPNLLIPERFDLLGGSNKKLSEDQQKVLLTQPPNKFRDDEKWTIWHKLDRSFNQPKVYAILLLGELSVPPSCCHSCPSTLSPFLILISFLWSLLSTSCTRRSI